jgi:hypothetical protein
MFQLIALSKLVHFLGNASEFSAKNMQTCFLRSLGSLTKATYFVDRYSFDNQPEVYTRKCHPE